MTRERKHPIQSAASNLVIRGLERGKRRKFEPSAVLHESDMEEISDRAWEHYRTFSEQAKKIDLEDNTAVKELHSLIDLLEPHVHPNTKPVYELTTKEDLLPVLISVAASVIADQAITAFFRRVDEPVIDRCIRDIETYTQKSLTFFEKNASTWIMGANFARLTGRLSAQQVSCWYDNAADCAVQVRAAGMLLMEDENDDPEEGGIETEVKEWIEVLLLNQVAGVEATKLPSLDFDDLSSNGSVSNKNSASAMDPESKWTPSSVEATSRFMVAMLPSISGDHATALVRLKSFPLTHRLHPNMWTGDDDQSEARQKDIKDPKKEPTSYRRDGGLLPAVLYKKLCHIFRPKSPYWKESGANKKDKGYYSFFSYLPQEVEFSDCGSSVGSEQAKEPKAPSGFRPSTIIEDVVFNYLLPLATRHLGDDEAKNIVGYEWWVQSRVVEPTDGTAMHFENDEATEVYQGLDAFPVLSSVMYLTGHDQGGTTVILDQQLDSGLDADHGWRSVPEDNSLLVFKGDLLRGTLPTDSRTASQSQSRDPRQGEDGPAEPTKTAKVANLAAKDGSEPACAEMDAPRVQNGIVSDNTPEAMLTTMTLSQLMDVADLWKVPMATDQSHLLPDFNLSLMVGFWTKDVPKLNPQKEYYTPCGPLPPDTEEHSWIKDIKAGYETGISIPKSSNSTANNSQTSGMMMPKPDFPVKKRPPSQIVTNQLKRVGPAWEEVESSCPSISGSSAGDSTLKIPKQFNKGFFLEQSPRETFRSNRASAQSSVIDGKIVQTPHPLAKPPIACVGPIFDTSKIDGDCPPPAKRQKQEEDRR